MQLETYLEAYFQERDLGTRTHGTYRYAVRRMVEWAGGVLSLQEACDRLNEFLTWLVAAMPSRYSVRSIKSPLVAVLRAAEDAGHCSMPQRIRPIKLPELEPIGFNETELRALWAHATPIQQAAMLLAGDTAFRHADLFTATWDNVSGSAVTLCVQKSRRRESRTLSDRTLEALRALRLATLAGGPVRKVRRVGPAVVTTWTQPGDLARFLLPWPHHRTEWFQAWRLLGARAAVDVHRRGLQAIRRTVASLVARERGVEAAARILGHSPRNGVTIAATYYMVPQIVDGAPPPPPPLAIG